MWFFLLDLGLGQSMIREFARYTAGGYTLGAIKNLSFSVEIAFIAVIIILLAIFYSFLQLNGGAGLEAQSISEKAINVSLHLMGISIAFRMLGTLYRRSLVGLQKQVTANLADVIINILRYTLTISVLTFYQASIVVFFICQVAASIAEMIFYKMLLMHNLQNKDHKINFQLKLLLPIWRYSLGAGIMAVLTISLAQADKLILINFVNLEQFGYYSVAYTVASALALLSIPITSGLHPKLAQLHSSNELIKLNTVYKYGCRALILILVPSALVMSLLSEQLLTLWQQEAETISQAAHITSLLILAQMSWLLAVLNQDLQLAHGHTRLLVQCQVVAAVVLLPTLYYASIKWGIVGAAFTILAVNSIYSIMLNYLGHRRWIPELKFKWYSHYLLPTLMATTAITLLIKSLFVDVEINIFNSLLPLAAAVVASLIVATLLSGELRQLIFRYFAIFVKIIIKSIKFN